MKKLLLLFLLFLPLLAPAQKVEVDEETHQVTVDGTHAFSIERKDCGWGMADCHFDVHDPAGKKVIRVTYRSYESPAEVKPSNTHGTVRYFEFVFLPQGTKAEVGYLALKEKAVAKFIAKAGLFVDGKLDEKAVEEFVLVHGRRFSEKEGR